MKKVSGHEQVRHHIDKKLQTRLRLYFIIAIVLLLIVIYNILRGDLSLFLSLVTFVIGIVAGIVSARMFHLSWNRDAAKIVSHLDGLGVVILILYILFAFMRETLLSLYVAAPLIGAATFAILAGIMLGRVLGTRGRIIQILKEEKII